MSNDTIPSGHKRCTGCQEIKPASFEYFYRTKRTPDGYRQRCKVCLDAQNNQWKRDNQEYYKQWSSDYGKRRYWENPEEHRAKWNQWRSENTEYNRQRVRDYYHANKDKERARHHRWASKSSRRKTYMQAYLPKYRQENPEIMRAGHLRRAARKHSLPDNFTGEQAKRAIEYFGMACACCQNPLYDLFGEVCLHFDHWIPLSDSRPDNPGTVVENMLPLCSRCNISKMAKNGETWLKQRFGRKAKDILKRIHAYFEWAKNQV